MDIDPEDFERTRRVIPQRGLLQDVLRVLIPKIADGAEKHGINFLGAIIDGKYEIKPTYMD